MNFCDWLFDGSPFSGAGWRRWVLDLKAAAGDNGVKFTQSHGPIFRKFEQDVNCRWLELMSYRSVEGASMLGIPWVVFEPETLPGAFDAAHSAETKRRNLRWFAPLAQRAETLGTGLALENVSDVFAPGRGARRMYCSTACELIDLVDSLGRANVGICWDTGHAHMQMLDQPQALRAVGSRLKALHIQDNNAQTDQHLLPFYGSIKWKQIMNTLREIEYAGDFTFEAHSSVRILPDELRDSALALALKTGEHLLRM